MDFGFFIGQHFSMFQWKTHFNAAERRWQLNSAPSRFGNNVRRWLFVVLIQLIDVEKRRIDRNEIKLLTASAQHNLLLIKSPRASGDVTR